VMTRGFKDILGCLFHVFLSCCAAQIFLWIWIPDLYGKERKNRCRVYLDRARRIVPPKRF
jgi:hypothetical protein